MFHVKSFGSPVSIFGIPVYVMSYKAVFGPFLISLSLNTLFSQIFCVSEPVRLEHSAAMRAITAETASLLFWEDDPSLIIEGIEIARSGHIRYNTVAEEVPLSVHPADTLTIMNGIVEHVSTCMVLFSIFVVDLLESHVVGEIIDWRIHALTVF